MSKKNTIPIRSDLNFVKEIKDMQIQRIMKGKDNALKPTRISRITLAMTRHPYFKQIKKDIIQSDLP